MAAPTLADIAARAGADLASELIEEAAKAAPEFARIPAKTIVGTTYKQKVRTALPTASFRNANEGSAAVKSAWSLRMASTFILNPRWECDKAVADADDEGPDAFIADEALGILQASLITVGKVFYYGTHATLGDAKGFPGLIDTYDATNMSVDAGGTTADTGSSVWLVAVGPQTVRMVAGQNGEMDVSPVRTESIADGSGNRYTAYVQELLAYIGMQMAHAKSVCRIKKLTADSGKGLTDALIYSALAKFPATIEPDLIFLTLRSLEQLRASRTATNPTGSPAPYPEYIQGRTKRIPLVATESLANTEALTL